MLSLISLRILICINRRREHRDRLVGLPSPARALIQINEKTGRAQPPFGILFPKDAAMPLDSILVSVGVVAMFAVFAGVLWWGDTQA